MGADRNSAWYVVRTKPRAEAFAAANLRTRAVEVFFPRLARRFARDAARAIEPLFPGYLFAHLSLDTQFQVASWTPGVAHLLSGADGAPARLDDAVVASLRDRADGGDVLAPGPAFRTGDAVEGARSQSTSAAQMKHQSSEASMKPAKNTIICAWLGVPSTMPASALPRAPQNTMFFWFDNDSSAPAPKALRPWAVPSSCLGGCQASRSPWIPSQTR